MKITVGYYVGNKQRPHAIAGLGFAPDFVLIVPFSTTGEYLSLRTSDMTGETAFQPATTFGAITDHIISLDADGFTLGGGGSVNENGRLYAYFAAAEGTGDTDFDHGTYTGNGNPYQNVLTAFDPKAVIVIPNTTKESWFKTETMGAADSVPFADQAKSTSHIGALGTGMFTVQTDLNASGITYYWLAFSNNAANSRGYAQSYVGSGQLQYTLDAGASTRAPLMAMVFPETSDGRGIRLRSMAAAQAEFGRAITNTSNFAAWFLAMPPARSWRAFIVGSNLQIQNVTYHAWNIGGTYYGDTYTQDVLQNMYGAPSGTRQTAKVLSETSVR